MTDITELAQSLKAAAIDAKELAIIARYSKGRAAAEKFYALANPNNIIALVEALEKAQQVDEELCKLLPPGAEYMDPPDGGDVTPLEGVRRMVADYRQRIASLEESHAQVIQSRDHYKLMSEEGLKHLAESRIVTVKLPRPGFVTISGERTAVYLKADVDAAMLAAGIEETE
ncbi:ead/Ea22-like family protein [Klebsiella variicola]|uniref:ead/Ea22-like family protein n=1 Tax=Klebsiella variicola TaxID=244366 RepID=UPI001CCC3575|nr:ead/Ea22-like family protein [Klebsiella variicola]MBZ7174610.1 ead/Ea22-like family protein [Klebsiella variicola]